MRCPILPDLCNTVGVHTCMCVGVSECDVGVGVSKCDVCVHACECGVYVSVCMYKCVCE